MKRESVIAATLALTIGGLLWGLGASQPRSPGPDAGSPTAAKGEGGYKVYIDPTTGNFIEEPADAGTLTEQSGRAVSGAELVVEPSPVPGGGMMIRTDESSDVYMKATLGTDDELSVDCAQGDHSSEKE